MGACGAEEEPLDSYSNGSANTTAADKINYMDAADEELYDEDFFEKMWPRLEASPDELFKELAANRGDPNSIDRATCYNLANSALLLFLKKEGTREIIKQCSKAWHINILNPSMRRI